MSNTSAINTVTKTSMKPRSDTTTNCHLRGSGERNGEQRRTKVSHDISIGAAAKVHLGTKQR